jgi:sulfoxide reductase heme-binding subunit YedZ
MTLSQANLARFVLKPLVLLGCLAPLAWLGAGVAGIGGVSLGANPVEEILHTLGKWGLNFLLITLCVTPLREMTGWVHWMRLRRMLGLTAFFYLLGHFLFYLFVDQGLDLRILYEDIVKRPYITVGFTALVLLSPLALTSTRGAMRRLGRRWQKLHRLVYVATLLGCVHYYWQVKADVREPLFYFAALAALLGWRWWKRRQRLARAATTMPERTSTPPRAVRAPTGSSSNHQASNEASTGSPVSAMETNAA